MIPQPIDCAALFVFKDKLPESPSLSLNRFFCRFGSVSAVAVVLAASVVATWRTPNMEHGVLCRHQDVLAQPGHRRLAGGRDVADDERR